MSFPSVKLRGLLPALLGLLLAAGAWAPAAPAAAQEGVSSNRVSRLRLRYFNPFSPLSSTRITASPFGLPQFQAPLAPAASTDAAATAAATVESEVVALPAVGRPSYRPKPRSPFRPPPRPPFF